MESLPSVSPSIAIHQTNSLHQSHTRRLAYPSSSPNRICSTLCSFSDRRPLFSENNCGISWRWKARESTSSCGATRRGGDGESEKSEEEDLERALHLDGSIPGSSDAFVKQVSSRAYDMRRHLHQTFDTSSYDGDSILFASTIVFDSLNLEFGCFAIRSASSVIRASLFKFKKDIVFEGILHMMLETNPWREHSKPVYVLTQRENQLCTMKTRRNRSEVERELGLLFPKGGNLRPEFGKKKQLRSGTKFRMVVEDVREGVLVFEDENEAARYCDLLQGGGQGCEGVAELEASSVFDICRKMRALAVLFRRGRTPPLPKSLELNLKARKRSLEDQEDLI
ncbi:hypothetical protein Syun_021099 [Stephania yunnanensis]|uniref:Uncharacterized protein n=1 Tax=Stephania yunnanensis TaxID=152371 RepID=A0AAP0IH09_9MAGN